jgi:hypothetical protein
VKEPGTSGKTITLRVQKGKEEVYPEFLHNVKDVQGGDICHVITSMMEAYNQAFKVVPDPEAQIHIKFPKQTIILNMGCNFFYQPGKARRLPKNGLPEINLDKNRFLPLFLEEFPSMKEASFKYYQERFRDSGLTLEKIHEPHTFISTPKTERRKRIKRTFRWSI